MEKRNEIKIKVHLLEDIPDSVVGESGTLHVGQSPHRPGQGEPEVPSRPLLVEVRLGSNQDERCPWAESLDLRDKLRPQILKTWGRHHIKAEDEDLRTRIKFRSEIAVDILPKDVQQLNYAELPINQTSFHEEIHDLQ